MWVIWPSKVWPFGPPKESPKTQPKDVPKGIIARMVFSCLFKPLLLVVFLLLVAALVARRYGKKRGSLVDALNFCRDINSWVRRSTILGLAGLVARLLLDYLRATVALVFALKSRAG